MKLLIAWLLMIAKPAVKSIDVRDDRQEPSDAALRVQEDLARDDRHTLPDEIDVTKSADVELLKATNDPAIWHEAAIAAFSYVGDQHGFLPWLVQQPNMDRATAGWLLLWPQGHRYLRGERDGFWAKISDSAVVDLLVALCERSERLGFSEDRVGLRPDFEPGRRACLDAFAKGEIQLGVTFPSAIVGKPFPAVADGGRYGCHDGLLINDGLFASIFK